MNRQYPSSEAHAQLLDGCTCAPEHRHSRTAPRAPWNRRCRATPHTGRTAPSAGAVAKDDRVTATARARAGFEGAKRRPVTLDQFGVGGIPREGPQVRPRRICGDFGRMDRRDSRGCVGSRGGVLKAAGRRERPRAKFWLPCSFRGGVWGCMRSWARRRESFAGAGIFDGGNFDRARFWAAPAVAYAHFRGEFPDKCGLLVAHGENRRKGVWDRWGGVGRERIGMRLSEALGI